MTTFHFYQTYVNISKEIFNGDLQKHHLSLDDASFRKYLIQQEGKTLEMIKILTPTLTYGIVKPQRLIFDEHDYYVANDMMTNTYYICYRTLMMIDIDFYKGEDDKILDIFKTYCQQDKSLLFRIFKTRNGLHAFLISRSADYRQDGDLQMMLDLGCDFNYTIYSHIRGWCVRLNPKTIEKEMCIDNYQLYTFLCDIGDGHIDQKMDNLVDFHLTLADMFTKANIGLSSMYGA